MEHFDEYRKTWRASVLLLILGVTASVMMTFCALTPAAVRADSALPGQIDATPSPTPNPGGLIAITFDDGPRRSTTTALLDGLAQRGVKATFFIVGSQVVDNSNQDLVLRMDQEGHEIGIHTYDHIELIGLNDADFSAQVDKTRNLLQSIIGHNGFLLRPPYGMTDAGIKRRANAPIILWSVDPEDWNDKNADRVVEEVLAQTKAGDIILLHDIFPSTVDAALRLVDQLHDRGFYFVTVSELFQSRQIPLEAGKSYSNAYP